MNLFSVDVPERNIRYTTDAVPCVLLDIMFIGTAQTDDTNTTCVPCPEFTFIDESNGLTKCFPCTVCYKGRGLRVNKACTRSSNTVCGPLEGLYCIIKTKVSCMLAVEHLVLENTSNKQVLPPQILCVITVQVKHIQMDLSHPV